MRWRAYLGAEARSFGHLDGLTEVMPFLQSWFGAWKQSCLFTRLGLGAAEAVPFYEAGWMLEAEFGGFLLHGFEAKSDVLVEIDAEFLGALNHIGTVDATGEGLVFHLLAHAGDFDLGDRLAGLTRAQAVRKPASSSQAKRHLSRWVTRGTPDTGHGRESRCASRRATQALQFTDSDKWVLFERGMAFVVEVVQEAVVS